MTVDRIVRDAPLVAPRGPRPHVCVCSRPDHQALIRQLAEAMGLDLPAIAATPEQVWEALLCEVERLARSAGGIDNADAARSEPSPVGDATTSVGPEAGL